MPVHTTGMDTNEDGLIDLYTHQKELLISGHYGKSTHTRLVVTGSSNYNKDGIRGDEEIFLIKNRLPAWKAYINDFQRMWKHFSTRVKYIPYPNPDPKSRRPRRRPRAMGLRSRASPSRSARSRATPSRPTAKPGGPAWESD